METSESTNSNVAQLKWFRFAFYAHFISTYLHGRSEVISGLGELGPHLEFDGARS